jgi:uncharacterized protein YqgQ
MTSKESVLLFKQNVWITQKMLSRLFENHFIDRHVYRKASHGLVQQVKFTLEKDEKDNG